MVLGTSTLNNLTLLTLVYLRPNKIVYYSGLGSLYVRVPISPSLLTKKGRGTSSGPATDSLLSISTL